MNANPVGRTATLTKGRRWAALAVLTASLLVITMDMTILNIALPELAGELQPTAEQQLWIIDIYSLVLAGLLVSWSAIADRWGRKRMLMLGYSIFAVASLLVLFADSAEAVIAIRGLLGVGGAMILPNTLSLIRVIFINGKERATALGIWAAVSGLGAAVGPLVGGLLLEYFSWHAAFLVNVPLMVGAIIAGIVFLPESRVTSPGRWDALAALLSFIGMILLVWAIKQFGKAASFVVPEAWIAVAIATLALTWFVIRCARSDAPLLDLRLFRSRPFSAGIIAAFGTTFSMIAALLLVAQWLQLVDGATPIEAGIRMMPLAITGAIASMLAPAVSRSIGARAVLAGGLGLAAIGMLYLGVAGSDLNLAGVIIATSLIGAGTGSLAIASAMIMAGSPVEKAGNAGALEETSYEFGATLGVAILGSISALIYRFQLAVDPALRGIDNGLLAGAKESLGAAVALGEQAGAPELIERASAAFVSSLQAAGFAGGLFMLAVAVLVFVLVPKGTDVEGVEH